MRRGRDTTGGKGKRVYLLAVLFLPAALAPSACKRNPKHLYQPREGSPDCTHCRPTKLPLNTSLQIGPRGEPAQAQFHSCRLGKSAPSGKRESGHPHPLTPHIPPRPRPWNLLGPLNLAEHPLPTQTQQPQDPGDSVKSK